MIQRNKIILYICFILFGIFMIIVLIGEINLTLYIEDMQEKEAEVKIEMGKCGEYIKKVYFTIGEYHIANIKTPLNFGRDGDSQPYDTIVNKSTNVCIEWVLRGAIKKNSTGYFYLANEDNYKRIFSETHNNIMPDDTLMGIKYPAPKTIDDVKCFGILKENGIAFYSFNELKSLSQEEQNILLDLKATPRFFYQ